MHSTKLPPMNVNIYDPQKCSCIEYGFTNSPFGRCLMAFTSQGLCALEFVDDSEEEAVIEKMRRKWNDLWVYRSNMVDARFNFTRYLPDDDRSGVDLCLRGTPFQICVWRKLLEIPTGSTVSYSELAASIGRPDAVRAVSAAVAANHIGFVVPCHRVIRNDGSAGKFRWGTLCKKAMIEWERNLLLGQ